MVALGYALKAGDGVAQDTKAAVDYWREAAVRGSSFAVAALERCGKQPPPGGVRFIPLPDDAPEDDGEAPEDEGGREGGS